MPRSCRPLLFLTLLLLAATPAAAQFRVGDLTGGQGAGDTSAALRSPGTVAQDGELVTTVKNTATALGLSQISAAAFDGRLVVTGICDDKARYDALDTIIHRIANVAKLYWHVAYVGAMDPRRATLLDWGSVAGLADEAQSRLASAGTIAAVNFATAADAFGTVYILGAARTQDELEAALSQAGAGKGVRRVVNYAELER